MGGILWLILDDTSGSSFFNEAEREKWRAIPGE
jgi:hypothetical protein